MTDVLFSVYFLKDLFFDDKNVALCSLSGINNKQLLYLIKWAPLPKTAVLR